MEYVTQRVKLEDKGKGFNKCSIYTLTQIL